MPSQPARPTAPNCRRKTGLIGTPKSALGQSRPSSLQMLRQLPGRGRPNGHVLGDIRADCRKINLNPPVAWEILCFQLGDIDAVGPLGSAFLCSHVHGRDAFISLLSMSDLQVITAPSMDSRLCFWCSEEKRMRSIEHRTVTHAAASGWITRFLGWLCFTVLMIPGVAPAMDFKIYYQPQLKLKMIIAEGRIQDGDADKFMALAKLADRDDEGLVILVLNSPGGNVEAAFRVVDAMDSVRVYTAVPDNARCASACASILFASGERRSVVGTGLLGFHSCYRRDGRTYAEDSLCNEIIAANAMQRGVSHAGINRFVKQYGATDMAWVGHDEACKSLQGLCKPGLLEIQRGTKTALMQSFDCSKLISVQDQLICGDSELASVDKALATVYGRKMKVLANRTRLRADQRAWLRSSRNACADKACLLQSYHLRIDELKRMRSQ